MRRNLYFLTFVTCNLRDHRRPLSRHYLSEQKNGYFESFTPVVSRRSIFTWNWRRKTRKITEMLNNLNKLFMASFFFLLQVRFKQI